MRVIYKAFDGKECDTEKECKARDALYMKAQKLAEKIHYREMSSSNLRDALFEQALKNEVTLN